MRFASVHFISCHLKPLEFRDLKQKRLGGATRYALRDFGKITGNYQFECIQRSPLTSRPVPRCRFVQRPLGVT